MFTARYKLNLYLVQINIYNPDGVHLLCGTGCTFRLISVSEGLMFIDTLDELTLLTVTLSCYPHSPEDRRDPVSRSLLPPC